MKKEIRENCFETTRHIADKILMLRRALKLTQEQFAEKVDLNTRTIARAESGKNRPSAETMEIIAYTCNVPVSYFFDNSVYRPDISKTALIFEINSKLNILSKHNLKKVKAFLNLLD